MADFFICEQDPPRKPTVIIKREELRRRRGCSRAQEYKELKTNPDWPQLVMVGGIGYYVESEAEAFLERLIEQGRVAHKDAERLLTQNRSPQFGMPD